MAHATVDELRLLHSVVERELSARAVEDNRGQESVCGDAECPCVYHYPGGMAGRELQARPDLHPRMLVVFGLCLAGEPYGEERQRVIQAMAPIRAEHANVRAEQHMGFLVFSTHGDAAHAQQRLDAAGFRVNFCCRNVHDVRGRGEDK